MNMLNYLRAVGTKKEPVNGLMAHVFDALEELKAVKKPRRRKNNGSGELIRMAGCGK